LSGMVFFFFFFFWGKQKQKGWRNKKQEQNASTLSLSLTQSRSFSTAKASQAWERRNPIIVKKNSFCFVSFSYPLLSCPLLFVSSALLHDTSFLPPSIPLLLHILLVDFERFDFVWEWQRRHQKTNYCS
jgi:hypothetical protein